MNESIYLGGWEVDFNNREEFRNFIIQHRLDKNDFDFFTTIQSGLEIKIENGLIKEVLQQPGNEKVSGPLDIDLPNSSTRRVFWLKKSLRGKHQLGGKLPNNLRIISNDSFKPFYLGFLNCQEEYFSWVGLDKIYLFYPLDFYYQGAFIDYSDSLRPELITEEYKFEYKPKEFLSAMKLETTTQVTVDKKESEKTSVHQCGVPLWYQYPELPKCPKTGELMRFLCSISSTKEIHQTKKSFFGRKRINEHLMFGDMGTLYVFYHPISKVAYLTIQF